MSEMEQPQPQVQPQSFTRLDIGMLIVLASMASAGLLGLIAVLDADSDLGALGIGFGVVWSIVVAGGTIACGLACLVRRRLEALALGALVVAGLAIDLFVLALWLEIDDETYGKVVGLAFVGSIFGLVVLGLSLACRPRDTLARYLYYGAVGASLLGATITAVLIVSTGSDDLVPGAGPVPVGFGNEDLLRPLAATLVVLGALWFGALAASRVEPDGD